MQSEKKLEIYELLLLTPREAEYWLQNEICKENPDLGLIKDIITWTPIDLNYKNKWGDSVFMNTLLYGEYEIFKVLLESGVNPNIQDGEGWTALMRISGQEETAEIFKLLLKVGANPNLQNDWGETALMRAVEFKEVESITLLLEAGADPDLQDENGETALMRAVRWSISTKLLLEAGANPHLKDNEGRTALDLTSERLSCDTEKCVELLKQYMNE